MDLEAVRKRVPALKESRGMYEYIYKACVISPPKLLCPYSPVLYLSVPCADVFL